MFTSGLSQGGSSDTRRPSLPFSNPFVPTPRPNRDQYVPRSWIVVETLWKTPCTEVRTINLDFGALICLAVPRGNAVGSARSMDPRFMGDNFERRMQSRVQTILSGSIHFRDVPSAWLYLSIIDWFRNEKPLSLCVSIHAIDEETVMFLNE